MRKPWPQGLVAASSFVIQEQLKSVFDPNFDRVAFNPSPGELSEAFRVALSAWEPLRNTALERLRARGAALWVGDGTAHCVSPYAARFLEMQYDTS